LKPEEQTKVINEALGAKSHFPAKVLVVDDMPSNLMVARGLLAPYGMSVDTASSGQDAIELLKAGEYDLVFMDHIMPEMDGIVTAMAIRARELEKRKEGKAEGNGQMPIIAMTANAMRGMKEFYLEQGFDDFLSKPVDPQSLDVVLTRWIKTSGIGQIPTANKRRKERRAESIAVEMEAQRLDMLNHYRISFESARMVNDFDPAAFERFTLLLTALDTEKFPADLKEQAAILIDAGQSRNALKIKEILPVFYEALRLRMAADHGHETSENRRVAGEFFTGLKSVIMAGEIGAAEEIMGKLGTATLGPLERELYFLLYDMLLDGDTEKAIGALRFWEKIKK
jgi:CheY-like chemotaxis protein